MKPKAPLIETRRIYLKRLERLIRMQRDYRDDINPVGAKLLDRCIEATYQDALDFGAGSEAHELMTSYLRSPS